MALVQKINIESDFCDYYDHLAFSEDTIAKYKRINKNNLTKGSAIAYMKQLGIMTIHIGTVNELSVLHNKLVVYTEPNKHGGDGKVLMSSQDAKMTYPNYLASPYYEDTAEITNKFLQIGKRRFRLVIENKNVFKFGKLLAIDEISSEHNYIVALPIFSIDYVSTKYGMLACDFNNVENLASIGLKNIINPSDIINEIYYSLVVYNKI